MSTSRRLVIVGFSLSVILFAGLLFWLFILNDMIKPISQVIWILLRIFVLSIPQQYYWIALIVSVAFVLFRRLTLLSPLPIQSEDARDSNATLRTVKRWRSLFTLVDRHIQDDETLKRNLRQLLLSFYAIKQHTPADFRLYDALQQGKIAIPEQIHAALFTEDPRRAKFSFKRLAQSIRDAPRKWIRHWTGQETAEDYRLLDEILCFIETSLEMKNDGGTFNPPQH